MNSQFKLVSLGQVDSNYLRSHPKFVEIASIICLYATAQIHSHTKDSACHVQMVEHVQQPTSYIKGPTLPQKVQSVVSFPGYCYSVRHPAEASRYVFTSSTSSPRRGTGICMVHHHLLWSLLILIFKLLLSRHSSQLLLTVLYLDIFLDIKFLCMVHI